MCIRPAPYSQELRDDVAHVARNREPGQKLSQIAKDLGISESRLTNRMNQADVEDCAQSGKTREEFTGLRDRLRHHRIHDHSVVSAQLRRVLPGRAPSPWSAYFPVMPLSATGQCDTYPRISPVLSPSRVARLAGGAVDECHRWIQRDLFGRPSQKDAPLYKTRRNLHTDAGLPPEKQQSHCPRDWTVLRC